MVTEYGDWIDFDDEEPEIGEHVITLWNWVKEKEKTALYKYNVVTFEYTGRLPNLNYWMPLPPKRPKRK